MAIWDHSTETMPREELAQLQLERLQASLFRAYRNVAFYRKRFDELGLALEEISALGELHRLPFTTREDLRRGYPYDMLAVPLREVVRLHTSSRTAGRPTVCAFTRNDLRHWTDTVARILTAGGVTRDDVVQIFFGPGMLANGLGFHGGAERLGASVIPTPPGSIDQQLAIMQDFKSTAIIGSAGEAAYLAEVIAERQLDIRRLSLRVGLFGAEPWSEKLRARIEHTLGVVALDHYALSEIGGPGAAGECPEKCGLHLAEDHFIAEVVDPQTGEPLPDGRQGELVLTTLTKEALPLIRFRTSDLVTLDSVPCACGRTLARISRITQRTDNTLIVQGGRLNPDTIQAILTEIEGAVPNYQILLDRKGGHEEVEIVAEVVPGQAFDTPGKGMALESRITERIQTVTGLTVRVHLVEAQTLARLAGEHVGHVIDRRE